MVTPALASYVIADDATGGDCYLVGTWDQATGTCTLAQDVSVASGYAFNIASDNVTLDGNSHLVQGTGGVYVNNRQNVKVSNLMVSGGLCINVQYSDSVIFSGNTCEGSGVLVRYSTNIDVLDNSIITGNHGIRLIGSSNSTVKGNTGQTSQRFASCILLANSTNNTIMDNEYDYCGYYGIGLFDGSHDNVLSGNTILDVGGSSFMGKSCVVIRNAHNNALFNNNFYNCGSWCYMWSTCNDITFSQDLPTGGNYWSRYDEEREGCYDFNVDGICDSPKRLSGYFTDYLPWATPNGWATPSVLIEGALSNIDDLISSGEIASAGVGTALSSSLENALASLDAGNEGAGLNQIEAAINKVRAQSGKKISQETADEMIALLTSVLEKILNQ
ncbi:MAG: right-handed parallel beta-helix repeat-containing protein [Thermodesulfovibrionales bacterium]|nr:right-handed parallel beta-helix repeat-containing protein [Thermodesulfovibrionales bacterium]